MKKKKIWLSWSSGKDCAYALHQLQSNQDFDVTGLLTTINAENRSVAMHGTPEALLNMQAAQLNLPLHCVEVGAHTPFENNMQSLLKTALEQHVSHIAFGDLFLREVRAYREQKMKETGIDLLFPLWDKPTPGLAKQMIDSGLKAVIVSVNLKALPLSFLGRVYDEELLKDLPAHVDPCGENGEFHTFVFDSPLFHHPIPFSLGEVSIEDHHAHRELL